MFISKSKVVLLLYPCCSDFPSLLGMCIYVRACGSWCVYCVCFYMYIAIYKTLKCSLCGHLGTRMCGCGLLPLKNPRCGPLGAFQPLKQEKYSLYGQCTTYAARAITIIFGFSETRVATQPSTKKGSLWLLNFVSSALCLLFVSIALSFPLKNWQP